MYYVYCTVHQHMLGAYLSNLVGPRLTPPAYLRAVRFAMRRRFGGWRAALVLLLALARGAIAQVAELPTAAEHIRNSPVDLAYSNTATLARSSETTPWLNRDKSRVVTSVDHTGRPALASGQPG